MTRLLPLLLLAGGSALLTASCASAPDATLMALDVHSAKFGSSETGNPYTHVFVGQVSAALVKGRPVEIQGPSGTSRFMPNPPLMPNPRTKVVDGVLHFIAVLSEKDYFVMRRFTELDRNVRVVFVDEEGHRTEAAGQLTVGGAFYGRGLDDYHPVWKRP